MLVSTILIALSAHAGPNAAARGAAIESAGAIRPWALGPVGELGDRCAAGDHDACARMAYQLTRGLHAPPDHTRALELSASSCEAGAALGCVQMAVRHERGNGVEASEELAIAYRLRARALEAFALARRGEDCAAGDLEACTQHARAYLYGIEGAQGRDPVRAEAELSATCEAGYAEACWWLEHARARPTG